MARDREPKQFACLSSEKTSQVIDQLGEQLDRPRCVLLGEVISNFKFRMKSGAEARGANEVVRAPSFILRSHSDLEPTRLPHSNLK